MSRRWLASSLLLLGCRGGLEMGVDSAKSGDLAGALARWEEVRSAGHPSSDLLFDLGCVYREQGDLPNAIAAWRWGRQLAPRDSDLAHNLALARGELSSTPEPAPARAGWMEVMAPSELGGLGVFLLLLGSGLALVRMRAPDSLRPQVLATAAASIGFGAVLVTMAERAVSYERTHPIAVVRLEAQLRTDAMPNAERAFSLPPGTEVRVATQRRGFVGIETGDGRRGWLAREALILLLQVPPG